MKIGFLFSGQGSQSVGMGKDIYEQYKETRKIYDKVKEITGIDIAKISFEGPEKLLNETEYTQLAILTMSLAIVSILKQNKIIAEISAGLSLGEYSALISSNKISFEEGVKIVQKRGEYMQTLLPKGDWKMAAILGLTDEQVEEACKKGKKGFATVANYNCKGQVVISGEKEAVLESATIAKNMGAKKVKILNTAGPFHTSKLVESAKAFRKELDNITTHPFTTKVVKNIDGECYKETDDIRDILANHMIYPVRFSKTLQTMLEEGINTFIEIGPSNTLSSFVKRMQSKNEIKTFHTSNVENLRNTINFIINGAC